MLFAQIPARSRDKLAADLKFDLKLVSLSLRQNPSEDTRYSKLEAVERYIRDEEALGTVDEPEAWFVGEMSMIAGPLGRPSRERPPVVYFSGETEQTIVGLGGALRHMVGAPSPAASTYEFPSSSIASLVEILEEEAEHADQVRIAQRQLAFYDQLWPVFMETLLQHQKGIPQEVEFLARRLTYTPPGSPQVEKAALLGSPIYVAAA